MIVWHCWFVSRKTAAASAASVPYQVWLRAAVEQLLTSLLGRKPEYRALFGFIVTPNLVQPLRLA